MPREYTPRESTPILCRNCPAGKPFWHALKGEMLPGGRMKCISLSGICPAIKKILARIPPETGARFDGEEEGELR